MGVPPGGVKDTADPPEKPDPLIVTEVSGLSSETLPGVTLEIEACGRADAVIVTAVCWIPRQAILDRDLCGSCRR